MWHPHLLTPTLEYQYQTFSSICCSTIIPSARADLCSCHETEKRRESEKQIFTEREKWKLWGRKVRVYGVMELSGQQYPRPSDPSPHQQQPQVGCRNRTTSVFWCGCTIEVFQWRSICGSDPCSIHPIQTSKKVLSSKSYISPTLIFADLKMRIQHRKAGSFVSK